MISSLIWNIRGVGKSETRLHLRNLCRTHKISFLAILEPMVDARKILILSRQLGFHNYFYKTSNKIWCFWKDFLSINIISDNQQVVHLSMTVNDEILFGSIIYASCFRLGRLPLWQ